MKYNQIIPRESSKLDSKNKQHWKIQRNGETLDTVDGSLREALRLVSRHGKGAIAVNSEGQSFEPY